MSLPKKVFGFFMPENGNCHGSGGTECHDKGLIKIAIVGNPNVGKSVIFNNLTGAYATVSNYPGTTVEVFRGKTKIENGDYSVVDTPGMYSLLPITEEERIARNIIFTENPDVVLHVVDARNLSRMLPLTLQLIEAGLPVVLDLNMMDESENAGMGIDLSELAKELEIPVVATVGIQNRGTAELKKKLWQRTRATDG